MSGLFGSHPEPIDASARYAQVAVERGIERALDSGSIDGTLSYRVPDGPDAAAIRAGDRVQVPLGRGNTLAEGIVVRLGGHELLAGLAASKVKPLGKRTGATLPPGLIDLAVWLAQYYVCPLGMVFAAMMPAAVKRGTGSRTVTLVHRPAAAPDAARVEALSPAMRRAWAKIEALPEGTFPLTPKALAADLERVSIVTINRLIESGLLTSTTRSEISSRQAPASPSPPIPSAFTPTPEQARTIAGIAGSLGAFSAHLIRGVTGSGKTEVYLGVLDACLARGQTAIVLVPEISLTPQTSRRFVDRFGSGRVAVLHSGLTATQRHAQWAACAEGRVSVVVGARSAIFAPLENLGVIVVDEEHDSSYKQDQLPRYHARDVAVKRAHLLGCPVILGSATPSLESYANAQPGQVRGAGGAAAASGGGGKYRLWTLPARVGGASLPRVEIVDLAEERRARAAAGGWRDPHLNLLGPKLEAALGRTLAEGGQAILLLNKRGYANYISCPDQRCGWVMQCDHCDATMVMHLHQRLGPAGGSGGGTKASGGYLRCHHCLAEQILPKKCPRCDKRINTFGLGTQRVEEELERKLAVTHNLRTGPSGTLLRVDGDTMKSARDYFEALDRFARGEVMVLLGTQMIAKGLDFPNVRLVGVINADTALALPDFRASERTFQLVSQVAGRAGRSDQPGLAIVQTLCPDAPPIRFAAAHDYEGFAAAELAIRTRAALPPAVRMARIVCRDEDHAKALAAANTVHAALETAIGEYSASLAPSATTVSHGGGNVASPIRLRPPAPCPISRIASHFRFGIELYAQTRGVIQTLLASVRARGLLKSDAHTAVDVDPIALL